MLLVTGSAPDANALSQETFLRAFTAKDSLDHVASPRSWLFAIATHLCWNRLRSMSRGRLSPTSVADKDQEAAIRGGTHAVAVAITRLPLRLRLAFALRKFHDFDYEGIERMLGCPKRSARGCVIRAFRKVSRMRAVQSAIAPVVDAPRRYDADAPRWAPRASVLRSTDDLYDSDLRIEGNRREPAPAGPMPRAKRGGILITDGPFAETKELFGGHYVTQTRRSRPPEWQAHQAFQSRAEVSKANRAIVATGGEEQDSAE